MPRSLISKAAADILGDLVIANVQQAIYQDSTTVRLVMRAEATQKFIAIPPIISPSFSQHLQLAGMPQGIELYRDQEFYFAFNSTVNTDSGGWVPGGVQKVYPLNPGLTGSTLAIITVVGTNDLRVNWLQL